MNEPTEIEGYVAWHPEYGARLYTVDNMRKRCWIKAGETCIGASNYESDNWQKKMYDAGWRVRKCKIVLEDEK